MQEKIKKLWSNLSRFLTGSAVLLVTSVFFIGLLLSFESSYNKNSKLTRVESGVNTCFKRVFQSFMATSVKLTGVQYLRPDFLDLTQECFGDVLGYFEENVSLKSRDLNVLLNSISTEVFWFHKDLKHDKNRENNVNIVRFGKLDQIKEKLYKKFQKEKVAVAAKMKVEKGLLFFSGSLLFVLILTFFLKERKIKSFQKTMESNASESLKNINSSSTNEIEIFFKELLEGFGLQSSSKLFSKFKRIISEEKSIEKKDLKDYNRSVVDSKKSQKQKMEPEAKNLNLEKIYLSEVVSKVVKILADKIFTKGILIEVKVKEELYVYAKFEALQHVFYNLMSNAINALSENCKTKKISVISSSLGGGIVVSVLDSGPGFEASMIQSEEGVVENKNLGTGLKICQEFMKEFTGKVSFLNKVNEENRVEGAVVNLFFKGGEDREKRDKKAKLVNLKRGSKKELLKEFKKGNNLNSNKV